MKRLFGGLALILASCSYPNPKFSYSVPEKVPEIRLSSERFMNEERNFDERIVEAFKEASKIEYVDDDPNLEGGDYWQTPQETISRGKGDCDDIAIYLEYLLNIRGIKVPHRVVLGRRSPSLPRGVLHFWNEVRYDGDLYVLDAVFGTIRERKNIAFDMYVEKNKFFKSDIGKDRLKSYSERLKKENSERFVKAE